VSVLILLGLYVLKNVHVSLPALKGVEVCKLQNNYRGTNIFSGTELLAVRFEVFQYCNYIYIYIYIYMENCTVVWLV